MYMNDNFKKDINNLPNEVLIYIFINEYDNFKIMMPYIENEKLKLLYTELKYLEPSSY
jgi:hypothetical protein